MLAAGESLKHVLYPGDIVCRSDKVAAVSVPRIKTLACHDCDDPKDFIRFSGGLKPPIHEVLSQAILSELVSDATLDSLRPGMSLASFDGSND